MAENAPLLNLQTSAEERPVIAIDGTRYAIAMPDDFSLLDQQFLVRQGKKLSAGLDRLEDLSEAEIADLESQINELLTRVMIDPIPTDVLDKLGTNKKAKILEVFTKLAETETTDLEDDNVRNG